MGWPVISHGEQAILPKRVFQWKRTAVVNHESKARICKVHLVFIPVQLLS